MKSIEGGNLAYNLFRENEDVENEMNALECDECAECGISCMENDLGEKISFLRINDPKENGTNEKESFSVIEIFRSRTKIKDCVLKQMPKDDLKFTLEKDCKTYWNGVKTMLKR